MAGGVEMGSGGGRNEEGTDEAQEEGGEWEKEVGRDGGGGRGVAGVEDRAATVATARAVAGDGAYALVAFFLSPLSALSEVSSFL